MDANEDLVWEVAATHLPTLKRVVHVAFSRLVLRHIDPDAWAEEDAVNACLDLFERILTRKQQGHALSFIRQASLDEKKKLLSQLAQVDCDHLERLTHDFLDTQAVLLPNIRFEPAPVIEWPNTAADCLAAVAARAEGEKALRAGRLACFLVAGGQGTRLGLSGPKGCFEIGPVTKRTLFQIHAEKILALRRRYGTPFPWVIMTSTANDEETRSFFSAQDFFGLKQESVFFCVQENMPAVSNNGKLLLESKVSLALSPNGHGGSIKALHASGALHWLREQGADTLFYFQVDNPLTKMCDPLFVGHHLLAQADMSSKVLLKANWDEKVGVVGYRDGKLGVIEYFDLPKNLAQQTDAAGKLRFWAGNSAIHVLGVNFVERLNQGGFQLPYHTIEKDFACIGVDGAPVQLRPGEKNGIKFETFVFDALPLARATVTLETQREEDFAPVKNAAGVDSPATARALLTHQYVRWLEAAGHRVPRKADGMPDCRLEISPLTSLDGTELSGQKIPEIKPGADVVL